MSPGDTMDADAASLKGAVSSQAAVSKVALAAAVISGIGLFFGNLLGLVLAMVAIRMIDAARGRLCGYRLVLAGFLGGVAGLLSFPALFPDFREGLGADVAQRLSWGYSVIVLGFVPMALLAYGLQDLLPAGRREYGYAWLGANGRWTVLDVVLMVPLALAAGFAAYRFMTPGGNYTDLAGSLTCALFALLLFRRRRGARAVGLLVAFGALLQSALLLGA